MKEQAKLKTVQPFLVMALTFAALSISHLAVSSRRLRKEMDARALAIAPIAGEAVFLCEELDAGDGADKDVASQIDNEVAEGGGPLEMMEGGGPAGSIMDDEVSAGSVPVEASE